MFDDRLLPDERTELGQEEREEHSPGSRRREHHAAPAGSSHDDRGEEQAEEEHEREAAQVQEGADVDVGEVQHLDGAASCPMGAQPFA